MAWLRLSLTETEIENPHVQLDFWREGLAQFWRNLQKFQIETAEMDDSFRCLLHNVLVIGDRVQTLAHSRYFVRNCNSKTLW